MDGGKRRLIVREWISWITNLGCVWKCEISLQLMEKLNWEKVWGERVVKWITQWKFSNFRFRSNSGCCVWQPQTEQHVYGENISHLISIQSAVNVTWMMKMLSTFISSSTIIISSTPPPLPSSSILGSWLILSRSDCSDLNKTITLQNHFLLPLHVSKHILRARIWVIFGRWKTFCHGDGECIQSHLNYFLFSSFSEGCEKEIRFDW